MFRFEERVTWCGMVESFPVTHSDGYGNRSFIMAPCYTTLIWRSCLVRLPIRLANPIIGRLGLMLIS